MVKRKSLEAAALARVLNPVQVDPLFTFLSERTARSPQGTAACFNGMHILYYLGGMLAIGAASLLTTLAVEAMGMGALLVLSILYALVAVGGASWLGKRGLGIPAGIFATLAVALTPLAVYTLQHVLGFWADGPDVALPRLPSLY